MKYSLVPLIAVVALLAIVGSCSSPDPAETMKPITDTYIGVWNGGDPAALDPIVDAGFVRHLNSVSAAGLDLLKSHIALVRETYPDFNVTLDHSMYTKDGAVGHFTFTGTHSGKGGAALAGKKVKVSGQNMIHVANGKITEEWVTTEDLTMMTQLGYTLTPPAKPKETAKKGTTAKKGATAVKSTKATTKKPAVTKKKATTTSSKKAPAKKTTTKKN